MSAVRLEPSVHQAGRWILCSAGHRTRLPWGRLSNCPEALLYGYYGYTPEEWAVKRLVSEDWTKIGRGEYYCNGDGYSPAYPR